MPVPVRIVKVLAGGAVVAFSDGSTRLVMPETVEAWKRFGFNVKEGKLNAEELRIYKQVVELFPHYSGLPAEEVVPEETIPEVIEDVPDVAVVPEVTADSELRTGHFGQGWMPDFWHNAQVKWQQELERARNKNIIPETSMEILEEGPIEDIVTTPKITVPQVSVIDLADTKDLPNTIKVAQSIGSIFYKGKDGKKKLAVYKSQLEDFRNSVSYMKGRGSAIDQARKWMEAQIGAGTELDFNALGGEPRFELGKDWDTVTDRLTLPDAGAAEVTVDLTKSDFSGIKTVDDLEKELDAIEKERIDLDAELGEFPARYPDISGLIPSVDRTAPLVAGKAVPVPPMQPIESRAVDPSGDAYDDLLVRDDVLGDQFLKSPPLDQLVTEPRRIVPEGYTGAIPVPKMSPLEPEVVTYKDRLGRDTVAKEIPWETRYPLGPQEWGEDDAGLADRQWIDPHPNAINVDLGEYYKIPLDQRDKIYKPPESRWDVSKSGGSVWDRERRAAIEGRGMVDEFGEIQKQAEQDAIEKAALDEWWAQARAETYQDELGEYDQYGTLSGMQEGVGMTQGIPDPLSDFSGDDYGDVFPVHDLDPVPEAEKFEYWLDKSDETPFLPFSDPRSQYGVGGDIQEFMYNGELWYLTKQGEYAKDYKRSELVTPWQTLPTDFFSR